MIEDKCPTCPKSGYCDCGASEVGSSASIAFVLLVALAVASMIGACIGLIIVKVITL